MWLRSLLLVVPLACSSPAREDAPRSDPARTFTPDEALARAQELLAPAREALAAGDLPRARASAAEAIALLAAIPSAQTTPVATAAMAELGTLARDAGDLASSRLACEHVLEWRMRTLPPDHLEVQRARLELAAALASLGDLEGARELQTRALDVLTRTLPAEHPDIWRTRRDLASTLETMGDLEGARALRQRVADGMSRALPGDHPDLQAAREQLAATLGAGSIATPADVATLERTLPDDDPRLQSARCDLAWSLAAAGESARLRATLVKLGASIHRALHSPTGSPHESSERIATLTPSISTILALDPDADGPVTRLAFDALLQISSRSAEQPFPFADDSDLLDLEKRLRELRAEVVRFVGEHEVLERSATAEEIERLFRERQRLEEEVEQILASRSAHSPAIEAEALAATLPEGACAVRLSAYTRVSSANGREDLVLAYILSKDGSLQRIELGPLRQVESTAETWSAALAEPVSARKKGIEPEEAGRALRELVLDPVLAPAGDVRAIFLWSGGLLSGVPLDALPSNDGLVGERVAIHREPPLLAGAAGDEARGEPSLLVLGGVDYDAAPAAALVPGATGAPPAASAPALRGARHDKLWPPLPDTAGEVHAIAATFGRTFDRDATVLEGAQASKAILLRLAPSARFLHVATHGWFEPRTTASSTDPGLRAAWVSLSQSATGFAPTTLSGLALAGANLPGVQNALASSVTAEELAGLDLARCELAVLAAGDTAIGVTRRGQGVASSQAALRRAGARTVVAALWKVDDASARELFADFYERIWTRGEPKAQALWSAKMALRAKGRPARDWAAWILTGEPE